MYPFYNSATQNYKKALAPPPEGSQEKGAKTMPNVYLRRTILHSVSRRLTYISSKAKQENLLAVCDLTDGLLDGKYWEALASESQASFLQNNGGGKLAVEAEELIMQLPNSLLPKLSADEVCRTIADYFQQVTDTPCRVALHYNKAKSNLHAHLIYPERDLLPMPEVKIAPRNLFFDQDGKRRYKKAEVLDENRKLRPGCRIVSKGEIYEQHLFGPVVKEFRSRKWLKDMKEIWLVSLLNGPLRGDVEFTAYDPSTGKLPQQHVGKNLQPDQAAAVREYNEMVREYNNRVDSGEISREDALMVRDRVVHAPRKAAALQQALEDLPAQEVDADQAVVVLVKRYSETLWTGYLEDLDGQLWIVDGVLSKPEERGIVEGATVRLSEGKYHLAEDWERQALQEALQGPEEPQEGYGGVQGYADFLKAKNGPEEPQESRGR